MRLGESLRTFVFYLEFTLQYITKINKLNKINGIYQWPLCRATLRPLFFYSSTLIPNRTQKSINFLRKEGKHRSLENSSKHRREAENYSTHIQHRAWRDSNSGCLGEK